MGMVHENAPFWNPLIFKQMALLIPYLPVKWSGLSFIHSFIHSFIQNDPVTNHPKPDVPSIHKFWPRCEIYRISLKPTRTTTAHEAYTLTSPQIWRDGKRGQDRSTDHQQISDHQALRYTDRHTPAWPKWSLAT